MLSFRHKTVLCHKTTSSSNPYFRLDNYPFIASKLNICLVFNQVHSVQTNAPQLWAISERISGWFVAISEETFCMWPFETGHTEKLRGKKPSKIHEDIYAHMWCSVFGISKYPEGKKTELELAGEKARHSIDHL